MCFSLAALQQFLIWLIVIVAVVALLKLVVPYILSMLGVSGGIIMAAINIFVWAIVAIFVVMFIFQLISCLVGAGGGLHMPSLR